MSASVDMPTPVTRSELREELEQLETRVDQKLEQLETRVDRKLERLDQKLEFWGGALLARIESGEQRMIQRIDGVEQRLLAELARHTKAVQEAMASQIAVIDEKYADLPGRVNRLEGAVFPSRKRR